MIRNDRRHATPLPSWVSNSVSLTAAFSNFLKDKRWFAGKAETLRSIDITECIPVQSEGLQVFLLIVRVRYASGREQQYALPLKPVLPAELREEGSRHVTIEPQGEMPGAVLSDALEDPAFARLLLRNIRDGAEAEGVAGKLVCAPSRALWELLEAPGGELEPSLLTAEQSNTSIKYGDRLILKFFRRAEEGVSLDLETGRFLTEKTRFDHIPPLAGSIEYRREGRRAVTLAILQGFVRNRGDAWKYTLDRLDEYFQRVANRSDPPTGATGNLSPAGLGASGPPPFAREIIGAYLSSAALLGRRTAELHLALASDPSDPEFAPEPFTARNREALAENMARLRDQALRLLQKRMRFLDPASREKASLALSRWEETFGGFRRLLARPITAQRTRVHGDYHLGQVLFTGTDFVIIDFEGEPERPLSERRAKHSPLRDVAGMLRSFHYAACTAVLRRPSPSGAPPALSGPLLPWARYWRFWASVEFLRTYLETTRHAALIPREAGELGALLDFFVLEKAAYELIYELNNRPGWAVIPLEGIIELADAGATRPERS